MSIPGNAIMIPAAFAIDPDLTFVTLVFRQRFAVLSVLVLLAALALVLALRGQDVPVGALFLSGLSVAAAFGVAFAHLRHEALAAVSSVAPLPGLIAVAPVAINLGLGASTLLAVYGLCAAVSAFLCGEVLRAVIAGRPQMEAAMVAPASLVPPIAGAEGAAMIILVVALTGSAPRLGWGLCVALVAATISLFLFVAAGATVLPFEEAAITRANRARERRDNFLRLAPRLVEPRWGLSLAGIMMVLALLGYFGAEALLEKSHLIASAALWIAGALVVFAAAFASSRDWREALAVPMVLGTHVLVSFWLWRRLVGHLTVVSVAGIAVAVMCGLLVMLVLLDRARRYRGEGDEPAAARLRAVEDCAVPTIFGCGGAAAAIAPWTLLHGSMATLALLFALGGAVAAAGMPAIATAIDALVRRKVSLESLYGKG